jgi:hypothetical protein
MLRGSLLLLSSMVFLSCEPHTFVGAPKNAAVVVTAGRATITWDDGDNSTLTLVVRTIGGEDPVAPTGGGVVGESLGASGTILARLENGTGKYIDNKLPDSCGPFAWHLWSRSEDGSWARTPASVSSKRGAHTLAPTALATDVLWATEGDQVRLAWTPPEITTGFVGVSVIRQTGRVPTSSEDGTVIYTGPSTVTNEAIAHLSTSEPTYYAVYNCNVCGKCGTDAPNIEVQPGTGPTLDIHDFVAALSADGRSIELSWSSTSPNVRILRSLNGAPSSAFDGAATLVFSGTGAMAITEPLANLNPQVSQVTLQKYTYKAFACAGGVCGGNAPEADLTVTLRQALLGGGYSIFFHHATALTGADKTDAGVASQWWKSCDPTLARQLTPTASDSEIYNLKVFFANSGVEVSKVYASDFCRAQGTATGLELGLPVIPLPLLNPYIYPENMRCSDTLSALNEQPDAGTNFLFVGHAQYQGSCTNLDGLIPGQAAIYKPQRGAPTKFIGLMNNGGWAQLP